MKGAGLTAIAGLLALLCGCISGFGERARYGITFYCPGVGNMDLGDEGLRRGLEEAGYRGQVVRMTWSLSFNPAIDQTVRIIARRGGHRLARYISEYIDQYPGREVNVVGLSAGTGVALWGLEALAPRYRVDNVVLIASSLSRGYDVSRALPHVKGKIYNFCSKSDAVLAGPMKVFGTIDGKFLAAAAGTVGLRVPSGAEDRVVNIPWERSFEQFGYNGGHTDGTAPAFVRAKIAPCLIREEAGASPQRARAMPLAEAPPAAHPD